jgi:antitoxin ParD1/3/4
MATNPPLTSMNISLPEPLREFVDEQVAQGGFGSASEYVRQLIRHAKENADAETQLLRALATSLSNPLQNRALEHAHARKRRPPGQPGAETQRETARRAKGRQPRARATRGP